MKRKIKLNKYPQLAQAELDLHGLTRAEATDEVSDFLAESADKNRCKIRIITGKGAGVLQECVRQILRESGLRFQAAKLSEGGSGAVDVFLD